MVVPWDLLASQDLVPGADAVFWQGFVPSLQGAFLTPRWYKYLRESGDGGAEITRILFAEVHRAFRQTASFLMGREPDLEVVAQAGSVAEGRRKMAEGNIDAAVVDVPLPDEYGIELVRELHDADPSIPVLVLSHVQDRESQEKLLEAGANEVLSKEASFEEILAAVRSLGEAGGIRVLISYEGTHLAYRDALVSAVRALRPSVAVTAVSLRTLASEIKRLDPHLVVSSRPNTVDPGGRGAWYTLAAEPYDPSEVCFDGERKVSDNPGLDDLLAAIDEAEESIRAGRKLGGC